MNEQGLVVAGLSTSLFCDHIAVGVKIPSPAFGQTTLSVGAKSVHNPLVTVSIKCMVLVSFTVGLVAEWLDFNTFVGIAVIATFLDIEHPLVTKNIFLVYTFCLFIFAGGFFFPDADDLLTDMLAYVCVYLIGYHFSRSADGLRQRACRPVPPPSRVELRNIHSIEKLMWGYLAIPLALFGIQLWKYGFWDYYQGAALVGNLESYRDGGGAMDMFGVVRLSTTLFQTGLCVYYVCRCFASGTKPNLRLLATLVIVVPLFSLNRGVVTQGCMFVAVVTLFCTARSSTKMVKWLFKFAVCGLVAVLTATVVGQIRVERLVGGTSANLSTMDKIADLVYGEFTPIVLYADLKHHIDEVGYRYGETLLLPLLFKPIPRCWMPDKPENASMVYMWQFHPREYAAGYSLAPSIFGDVYLNFGWYGCAVMSALLGLITGRLDRAFISQDVSGLPAFMIVHVKFYDILRNNTGDGLGLLLLVVMVYLVLRSVLGWSRRETAFCRMSAAPN